MVTMQKKAQIRSWRRLQGISVKGVLQGCNGTALLPKRGIIIVSYYCSSYLEQFIFRKLTLGLIRVVLKQYHVRLNIEDSALEKQLHVISY